MKLGRLVLFFFLGTTSTLGAGLLIVLIQPIISALIPGASPDRPGHLEPAAHELLQRTGYDGPDETTESQPEEPAVTEPEPASEPEPEPEPEPQAKPAARAAPPVVPLAPPAPPAPVSLPPLPPPPTPQ